MLKTIFLIEIIPDFQRYSFSILLHLTMQQTQAFYVLPFIHYIFDTKIFDIRLTNLWKSRKFENPFTVLSPPWTEVI